MEFGECCDAAVAFRLFERVFELEEKERHNEPTASWVLDLYAQCLATVRGERAFGESRARH